MRYLMGRDGAGVGAVAVHPARTHIAVAERSHSGPTISVYAYPSLQLQHVLVGGTERGFTDVNFSRGGDKLVSVGSFPDFLIAVWEWQSGRLILRTKAFGQEVFNARFTPDDEGRLTTSGTGHIRFWRMASTFTGLKLQGAIGKFGRVDLSDIHAFAELPDGKVVSGCEGGWLLLWDGGAIKTQIGRLGTPEEGWVEGSATGGAHDAPIHVVSLDRSAGYFLTGGDDGVLRWWDWRSIDSADMLPDGVSIPGVKPLCQFLVDPRARLRGLTKLSEVADSAEDSAAATGDDGAALGPTRTVTWLLQDRSGGLYKLAARVAGGVGDPSVVSSCGSASNVEVISCTKVYAGHGGAVPGVACSPLASEPYAATVGVDGSVRCWDTRTNQLVLATRFAHTEGAGARADAASDAAQLRGTALAWAPLTVDPTGRTVAAGFSDGTIRVLYRGGDEWKRLAVLKPVSSPLTALAFAPDGKSLAVATHDGSVFFYALAPKTGGSSLEVADCPASAAAAFGVGYTPVGFVAMGSVDGSGGGDAAAAAAGAASATPFDGASKSAGVPALSLAWSPDGASIAVGCADSVVRILTPPPAGSPLPDTSRTFDLTAAGFAGVQSLRLDLELKKAAPAWVPPPPEKEGKDGAAGGKKKSEVPTGPPADWPTELVEPAKPGGIAAVAWSGPARLLVACSGDGSHMLHELALPKNPRPGVRPTKPSSCYAIAPLYSGENVRRPAITALQHSPSGKLLLATTTTGSLFVRAAAAPAALLRVQVGDSESGGVVSVAATPDEGTVLVAGGDGALSVLSLPSGGAAVAAALVAAVPEHSAVVLTSYAPIDLRLAVAVGPPGGAVGESASGSGSSAAEEEKKGEDAAGGGEAGGAGHVETAAEADAARAAKDAANAAAALAAAGKPVLYLPTLPPGGEAPAAAPAPAPASSADAAADAWLAAHAAADITDPSVYSVQEDRLKSAEDARMRSAEAEKAKVRAAIAALRDAYVGLRTRAAAEAAVHPARGLTDDELVLDPELDALLRSEGEERLREVDRECAYDRQRRRVALSKLIRAFLADLIVDTETVSGIRAPDMVVSTLRTTSLPPELADAIATAEAEAESTASRPTSAAANAANASAGAGAAAEGGVASGSATAAGGKDGVAALLGATTLSATAGANAAANTGAGAALTETAEEISFDHRKKLRIERRAELKALEGRRPGPNDEDPDDAAAVAWAKDHMGDYRLKTDKAYRVPEGVKLDHVSKRRQTLLLEGYIFRLRGGFNARLLALRGRKRAVVAAVREAEAEVAAIDEELTNGLTARLLASAPGGEVDVALLLPQALHTNPAVVNFSIPDLDGAVAPCEQEGWESLTALAARHVADAVAERAWDARVRANGGVTPAPVASFAGVMSGFLRRVHGVEGHVAEAAKAKAAAAAARSAEAAASDPIAAAALAALASASQDPHAAILAPHLHSFAFDPAYPAPVNVAAGLAVPLPPGFSPLTAPSAEEVGFAVAAVRGLGDRKLALRLRQIALLEGFDAAVAALRRERLEVQAASVASGLRLSVLRQELALLTDMAKRDSALEGRLAKAKADKAGISTAVAQFAAQIADKKIEIDAFSVRERALLAEFDESIGSSHPAYSQLLKIYKRKIKRAKAPAAGGAGAQEEEEEEEDDLDDLDDIGDDDDDDEEETQPDNCDKATYERVLAMRNRRLDVTDQVDDINKQIDEIRKASDRQVQRERQVDRDLASVHTEIAVFQREKQGKLNVLDTWVVLKASQLVVGKQPQTLAASEAAAAATAAAATAAAASAGAAAAAAEDDGRPLGELPSSIDSCVLFTRAALRRLRSRIGELEGENKGLVVAQKELQKEEKALVVEKKALEAEIARVRTQCEEIMVLKFGRVIDVEALDRATGVTAGSLATIQQEQTKAEHDASAEVDAARRHLAGLQDRLTALVRAHTQMLETLATLQARVSALEGELSGNTPAGLTAVALHATLGTGLATVIASGRVGAHSLAALQPMLQKGASARKAAMGGAALDPKHATSAVTLGLTLNSRAGAGGMGASDETVAAKQEAAERERLVDLVARQAAVLEAMKAEMAMLKSKTGPAYVPPAPALLAMAGTARPAPAPRAPASATGAMGASGGLGVTGAGAPYAGGVVTVAAATLVPKTPLPLPKPVSAASGKR
jgi:WD40 repeat protein